MNYRRMSRCRIRNLRNFKKLIDRSELNRCRIEIDCKNFEFEECEFNEFKIINNARLIKREKKTNICIKSKLFS